MQFVENLLHGIQHVLGLIIRQQNRCRGKYTLPPQSDTRNSSHSEGFRASGGPASSRWGRCGEDPTLSGDAVAGHCHSSAHNSSVFSSEKITWESDLRTAPSPPSAFVRITAASCTHLCHSSGRRAVPRGGLIVHTTRGHGPGTLALGASQRFYVVRELTERVITVIVSSEETRQWHWFWFQTDLGQAVAARDATTQKRTEKNTC